MAAQKKKSPAGSIVFLLLVAAVVVGIYLSVTRKSDETKEIPVSETEAEVLIAKNLDRDYPATAREVLKLYCRITKCMYNDELTDEQVGKLLGQLRKLYSDELLEANTEEMQLALLLGDISTYHENGMSIYNYTVDSAARTETLTTAAGKTSLINMYFTIRTGEKMDRAYEEFSICQNAEGRWKIMAWRGTDQTNISDD